MHPNAEGVDRMVERILPTVEKADCRKCRTTPERTFATGLGERTFRCGIHVWRDCANKPLAAAGNR